MSLLCKSSFNPARGGHAPGDVRDAFLDAIDSIYSSAESDPLPRFELREKAVTFDQLCGLLWNCSDQMPGLFVTMASEMLGDQSIRGTYAAATRALKGRFA
jgi:hypothetical protein